MTNRLEILAGSPTVITGITRGAYFITYIGTGPFFTAGSGVQLAWNDVFLVFVTAGATVFDVDGAATMLVNNSGFIGLSSSANQSLGTIKNSSGVQIVQTSARDFETGIIFDSNSFMNLNFWTYPTASTDAGFVFCDFVGENGDILFVNCDSPFLVSGQALLNLDPIFNGTATLDFCNSSGDFFAQNGATGTITAFADASETSTTISSVQDNGGAAEFVFTPGPTLFVGQQVTISGYITNTAYNGNFIITEVSAGQFTVAVAFGTDEATGAFTSASVLVTDAAHGLSELAHILIQNSVNYNGGYEIYDVDTNDFKINATFVAETPTATTQWNTNSLDETDPRVSVQNSAPQKDSMTIGAVVAGGNTTETAITDDVITDLNLDALAQLSGSAERFTLLDIDTGEVRYDGLTPVALSLSGLIGATAGGGGQVYNFSLVKNDSPLPSPDNVDIPINIGSDNITFPIEWNFTASLGDTFKLRVVNNTNNQNIVINTLKFTIQ